MISYRPVSLIPIFSKVIEKVIYNALYWYLESNKILVEEQMGFRKNKSTNMAIFKFLTQVMTNVDSRLKVSALYLDMTKAFDYVDHDILMRRLYDYGIRGNILNLIRSYVTNRKQITAIDRICNKSKIVTKYLSSARELYCGVPHGSIMGPLLFLVYINDMRKIVNHPMILFADDCSIIFIDDNANTYETEINKTLNDIIRWLNCNNLSLNLEKSKIMTFSAGRKISDKLNINHAGKTIDEINITKFLGLYIDCNLTWKHHIEYLCTKLNKFAYALNMLYKVANHNVLITAYHAYVTSILRYGIIFWGNSVRKESVFICQKGCIRAICGLRKIDSCRPYFKKFRILTLTCLYIYEIVLFVKLNLNLYEILDSNHNGVVIKIPRNRSTLLNHSFYVMGPRAFNKLPKYIRQCDDLKIFKHKLIDFLLDKTYYTFTEYTDDKY